MSERGEFGEADVAALGLSETTKNLVMGLKSMERVVKDNLAVFHNLTPKLEKFANVAKSMEVFLNKMPPVSKKISESKFQKGVKELGKTFKSMAQASVQAWAMERLMSLMEPFISLLDLFTPLFEVFAGILQEALLPIIMELNPIIMLMVQWLMENKDMIILFINVLNPLLLIFHLLMGNFEELHILFISIEFIVKTFWTSLDWLYKQFVMFYELISGNIFILNMIKGFKDFFKLMESLYDFIDDNLLKSFKSIHKSFKSFKKGIQDIIGVLDNLNPFTKSKGKKKKKKKDKDNEWWDPLDWFGPEIYGFSSPQVIGVGDEGETEYLMGESKLKGLMSASGSDNTEVVYELQRLNDSNSELLALKYKTRNKLQRRRM